MTFALWKNKHFPKGGCQMVKKTLIGLAIFLAAAFVGSQVYAQWSGYGWGWPGPMMGGGWGYGHMMGPGYYGNHMGYGYGPQTYSKEYQEKIEKFYAETQGLRENLRQKYFELESLLNQGTPDQAKVLATQKEISQLQGQLEAKNLKFQLDNRDLAGTGTGGWYCGGPGMGWVQ
jgi:Spy/CpxP family protein refolding chaperone